MKNEMLSCDNDCGREADTHLCGTCFEEELEKAYNNGKDSILDE